MPSALTNEYTPDSVSPPGETLLETLEMHGMSQADFATRTGRSPKLINQIIKGKARITPDTALQFERVLRVPAEFWNNREQRYREFIARAEERLRLKGETDWLKRFPIRQMIKHKWIPKSLSKIEQLQAILQFFGVTTPETFHDSWTQTQVSFRKSAAFEADEYALAAWLQKGMLDALAIDCAPHDPAVFRAALIEARSLTVQNPSVFQPRLVELFAAAGVAIAFVPSLPKIMASGATRWITSTKALIQINLRYKTDDHFWFTIFHEAGHVLHGSKKTVFVDSKVFDGDDEEWANKFASEFLIPKDKLSAFATEQGCPHRYPSASAVCNFAAGLGISPGIVVGQLQHGKWVPHSHFHKLKRTFEWGT